MLTSEADVHGPLIVIDLEWVGDSGRPVTTHITQIAAKSVTSGRCFSMCARPIASDTAVRHYDRMIGRTPNESETHNPRYVLEQFVGWLCSEQELCKGGPVTVVAHNGIRYDIPVLLTNTNKYNVALPPGMTVLDSLHHLRYHMRHRASGLKYDMDSLCKSLDIEVVEGMRHKAMYDVEVLDSVLKGMRDKWSIPYISGLLHPITLSPMLCRGIGVTICQRLDTFSLADLCDRVLIVHGNLEEDSCLQYLETLQLNESLPSVNLSLIARSLAGAALRYLYYLP